MKYFFILITVIFISGCSPKYKIATDYIPPTSADAPVCLQSCEAKLKTCQSECQAKFEPCKLKANAHAKKVYNQKMANYVKELENYADVVEDYEFRMEMRYMRYGLYDYPFGPFYGVYDPFYIDPFPYYGHNTRKPRKPSLEAEELKAQAQMCNIDCGCSLSYDTCYKGCGGKIISKKICIENCPK